jgi:hypothetical protein
VIDSRLVLDQSHAEHPREQQREERESNTYIIGKDGTHKRAYYSQELPVSVKIVEL